MFRFNVIVKFVRHGSLVLELAPDAPERPRASDRSPSSSKLGNARHLDLVVVDFDWLLNVIGRFLKEFATELETPGVLLYSPNLVSLVRNSPYLQG